MSSVDLVITVAIAQELPVEWLRENQIPVHRLAALQSGAFKAHGGLNAGILVVITGVGLAAARDAALWIRDHLTPRFVVNLGTAGSLDSQARHQGWITPSDVVNEAGVRLPVDTRIPFPWPATEKRSVGGTLLSVTEARPGNPRESWRENDFVDMECHALALVFADSDVGFHVLKWISDHPGENADSEFRDALPRLRDALRSVLSFVVQEERPEISVVIPVHNRAERIGACLQSVLDQTLPAREAIVVDDGSVDGTRTELEAFGDRIRTVHLESNRGVSAARNAGIAVARSPWIALLDSDDHWAPDKLARQWEYRRQNPHYEALQCEEIWMRNGVRVNPHNHHTKPAGWIWSPSLQLCLVSPSAILLRRSLFDDLGDFDESLPACEDYDFWIRLARRRVVGLVPHAGVIKHGGHDDQLSRRYPAMDRFRVTALLKALREEREPDYRRQLVDVLNTKLDILLQGARKRGLVEEAQRYESLTAEVGRLADGTV